MDWIGDHFVIYCGGLFRFVWKYTTVYDVTNHIGPLSIMGHCMLAAGEVDEEVDECWAALSSSVRLS